MSACVARKAELDCCVRAGGESGADAGVRERKIEEWEGKITAVERGGVTEIKVLCVGPRLSQFCAAVRPCSL